MNKVISRRRVYVSDGVYSGKPVLAASVVRTAAGYDAVLIVDGIGPISDPGHASAADAEKRVFSMLDFAVPDFLSDQPIKEKKARSRAKAKVVETHSGGAGRAHGRYHYVITGATEGQIKYAVRRLHKAHQGYGLIFGELETIDGILTLSGSRSDNCE